MLVAMISPMIVILLANCWAVCDRSLTVKQVFNPTHSDIRTHG